MSSIEHLNPATYPPLEPSRAHWLRPAPLTVRLYSYQEPQSQTPKSRNPPHKGLHKNSIPLGIRSRPPFQCRRRIFR